MLVDSVPGGDFFPVTVFPGLVIFIFGFAGLGPDHAYHAFGIDAPESLEALKTADTCFGEILDEYARDDVQIVVASDHGHITVREHFDLDRALSQAGFKKGATLADTEADFVALPGSGGNLYVLNRELSGDGSPAKRVRNPVRRFCTAAGY